MSNMRTVARRGYNNILNPKSIDDFMKQMGAIYPGYYIPMNEITGTVATNLLNPGTYNGTYSSVTLGGDTFGGHPCPTFSTGKQCFLDYVGLESLIKPENASFVLTFGIAYKMTQAVYQDSNFHFFHEIGVDSNNRFAIYKLNAANDIHLNVNIGGVVKTAVSTTAISERYSKWNRVLATISKVDNRFRLYINGTKIGVDQTLPAGTWSASDLGQIFTTVGAHSNSFYMDGSLAIPFAFLHEFTQAEVTQLDNVIKRNVSDAAAS